MIHINPKYILDEKGNKQAVLLPLEEFNAMIDALEEADDVRLYD
ncbi:MAG TPA: hypothetical protein PLO39_12145 [Saprospiraceae bacterium]|jgi:PHD/YefM family antitoxin component YafN of YafNO toxin-antitoxin module|nr:hypothetical protein [Saprospiraceae bacterium]